jgi:hypothetical protein
LFVGVILASFFPVFQQCLERKNIAFRIVVDLHVATRKKKKKKSKKKKKNSHNNLNHHPQESEIKAGQEGWQEENR